MGRKRKSGNHLPKRVYHRHGAYYFVSAAGDWIPLGKELPKAMAKWAELVDKPLIARTMNDLFDRYMLEIAPQKAPLTYLGNQKEIQPLRAFFGDMRLADVTPVHIYKYLDIRGQQAPVRANREKALLSHVFALAIRWGEIGDNPCRHVKRLPEKPRNRYIEDAELEAFVAGAPLLIQNWVAFKYLTGLRQGDILAIRRDQLKEDGIHVAISKTGERRVIEWSEELKTVVAEIVAMPRPVRGLHLFCNRQGQPYTSSGFRAIWQRAMRAALQSGRVQERFTEHDIRGKAATDAEAAGMNAQKLLAHRHRNTTDGYIKAKKVERILPLSRKKP